MSNARVIAATTATLRQLLLDGMPKRDSAIGGVAVTTLPLDRVGADMTRPALNLFLYQTALNGAWRNRDAAHARPGESPLPPIALNLHYLLTAYGQVDVAQGDFSHRVLGAAVSVLHDHPVLGEDELVGSLATNPALGQAERIRITPLATSLEEMSKLWTTFQTNYRLSTAYEVSIVLIESDRATNNALPVLKRGDADRGPVALASPAPSLSRAVPPNNQAALRLGETLTLEGRNLRTTGLQVRISGRLLATPLLLDPQPGATDDRLKVTLPPATAPNAMSTWAPGFYTAVVLVPERPGVHAMPSNAVAFAIAPSIALSTTTPPAGALTLSVTCAPRMHVDQPATLLFGNRAIPEKGRNQPADTTQPTTVDFDVSGQAAEAFVVRLRVDGVDSIPVVSSDLLNFDPLQTVVFQ
jgi:hypothetical protein